MLSGKLIVIFNLSTHINSHIAVQLPIQGTNLSYLIWGIIGGKSFHSLIDDHEIFTHYRRHKNQYTIGLQPITSCFYNCKYSSASTIYGR